MPLQSRAERRQMSGGRKCRSRRSLLRCRGASAISPVVRLSAALTARREHKRAAQLTGRAVTRMVASSDTTKEMKLRLIMMSQCLRSGFPGDGVVKSASFEQDRLWCTYSLRRTRRSVLQQQQQLLPPCSASRAGQPKLDLGCKQPRAWWELREVWVLLLSATSRQSRG
jgi:hypothetical protein